MKKYKIGEVCSLNERTISRIEDIEIEYLDTSSITENNIDATQSVSLFDAPSRAQRLVKHHTIIYSLVRPKLEHHGIMDSPPSNLVVSTGFVTLDIKDEFEKDIDAYYLYLYLTQDRITQYLNTIAENSVSAYPTLSPKNIADIELSLPSIDVQQRVTSIISKLDRKIALNRAINHNLEAMTKQLYDYWFVQFDFPDENGKPYKSSGGKMVWNDTLKHNIPKGWSCSSIQEIESKIVTGKTPSTADETNFGGEIPFITIDDIRKSLFVYTTERTLSQKGAESQNNKYLPKGSLCCSCIGTTGIIGYAGKESQTNQQINSIVFTNDYYREFLLFSLLLYFQYAKAKTGNILPNMNKEEFSAIKIVRPTLSVLEKFHNIAEPLFMQIDNNTQELNSLTKQRDELLPLLMSGQVTVNYDLSAFSSFFSQTILSIARLAVAV